MDRRRAAGALLALAACVACSTAAPTSSNQTALELHDGSAEGCYYNFQHYGEGDRIMTNEPCLNCTCHNRMLMCYLRVCPFTKPIGQDCTVEKRADQCCPIVTCPDVPVDLLTSTSTSSPAEYGATGLGKLDKYGCSINGRYFPEGSKVPPSPNKPCEHCYCIRNMTTCVMQECTLHVDGCTPIYHKDVCCPVRYSCDHPEDEILLLDDMTTTVRPTPGFLLTTTTMSPVTQMTQDCVHDDQIVPDGALIKTDKACEHCYCMKGDIVCVVQECGTPMENEGKNCTSMPPRQGQCCPDTYICEGDELSTELPSEYTTEISIEEVTTLTPPRRVSIEGSGYRNEPDEPYTDMPIFEGSGDEQPMEPHEIAPDTPKPQLIDDMFVSTTEGQRFSLTTEPDKGQNTVPDLSDEDRTKTPIKEEIDTATQSILEGASTTSSEHLQTSPTGSYISREDEYIITTESTFTKEDKETMVSEIATEKYIEIATTNAIDYTEKVTAGIETDNIQEQEHVSSVLPEESEETKEPKAPTTESYIEYSKSTESKNDEEVQDIITPESQEFNTESTTKLDLGVQTTSINPIENEVDKEIESISSPGRIPGEGDCLLNGVTYKNDTSVPSTNNCHTNCKCMSSIIKCDPIICSPPPEYMHNMNDCQPIYDTPESCCPTYVCHSRETIPPESHSQMSGTETPKPLSDTECDGEHCQPKEEFIQSTSGPAECASGSCSIKPSESNETCGPDGCQPIIAPEPHSPPKCGPEGCQDGSQVSEKPSASECGPEGCQDQISDKPSSQGCGPEGCFETPQQPTTSECGANGCEDKIHTSEETSPSVSLPESPENCLNGKCQSSPSKDVSCNEENGCQAIPITPCEGDDCETQQSTTDDRIGSIDSTVQEDCKDDNCRRKDRPEMEVSHTGCTGSECENEVSVIPIEATTATLTEQEQSVPEAITEIKPLDDSVTSQPATEQTHPLMEQNDLEHPVTHLYDNESTVKETLTTEYLETHTVEPVDIITPSREFEIEDQDFQTKSPELDITKSDETVPVTHAGSIPEQEAEVVSTKLPEMTTKLPEISVIDTEDTTKSDDYVTEVITEQDILYTKSPESNQNQPEKSVTEMLDEITTSQHDLHTVSSESPVQIPTNVEEDKTEDDTTKLEMYTERPEMYTTSLQKETSIPESYDTVTKSDTTILEEMGSAIMSETTMNINEVHTKRPESLTTTAEETVTDKSEELVTENIVTQSATSDSGESYEKTTTKISDEDVTKIYGESPDSQVNTSEEIITKAPEAMVSEEQELNTPEPYVPIVEETSTQHTQDVTKTDMVETETEQPKPDMTTIKERTESETTFMKDTEADVLQTTKQAEEFGEVTEMTVTEKAKPDDHNIMTKVEDETTTTKEEYDITEPKDVIKEEKPSESLDTTLLEKEPAVSLAETQKPTLYVTDHIPEEPFTLIEENEIKEQKTTSHSISATETYSTEQILDKKPTEISVSDATVTEQLLTITAHETSTTGVIFSEKDKVTTESPETSVTDQESTHKDDQDETVFESTSTLPSDEEQTPGISHDTSTKEPSLHPIEAVVTSTSANDIETQKPEYVTEGIHELVTTFTDLHKEVMPEATETDKDIRTTMSPITSLSHEIEEEHEVHTPETPEEEISTKKSEEASETLPEQHIPIEVAPSGTESTFEGTVVTKQPEQSDVEATDEMSTQQLVEEEIGLRTTTPSSETAFTETILPVAEKEEDTDQKMSTVVPVQENLEDQTSMTEIHDESSATTIPQEFEKEEVSSETPKEDTVTHESSESPISEQFDTETKMPESATTEQHEMPTTVTHDMGAEVQTEIPSAVQEEDKQTEKPVTSKDAQEEPLESATTNASPISTEKHTDIPLSLVTEIYHHKEIPQTSTSVSSDESKTEIPHLPDNVSTEKLPSESEPELVSEVVIPVEEKIEEPKEPQSHTTESSISVTFHDKVDIIPPHSMHQDDETEKIPEHKIPEILTTEKMEFYVPGHHDDGDYQKTTEVNTVVYEKTTESSIPARTEHHGLPTDTSESEQPSVPEMQDKTTEQPETFEIEASTESQKLDIDIPEATESEPSLIEEQMPETNTEPQVLIENEEPEKDTLPLTEEIEHSTKLPDETVRVEDIPVGTENIIPELTDDKYTSVPEITTGKPYTDVPNITVQDISDEIPVTEKDEIHLEKDAITTQAPLFSTEVANENLGTTGVETLITTEESSKIPERQPSSTDLPILIEQVTIEQEETTKIYLDTTAGEKEITYAEETQPADETEEHKSSTELPSMASNADVSIDLEPITTTIPQKAYDSEKHDDTESISSPVTEYTETKAPEEIDTDAELSPQTESSVTIVNDVITSKPTDSYISAERDITTKGVEVQTESPITITSESSEPASGVTTSVSVEKPEEETVTKIDLQDLQKEEVTTEGFIAPIELSTEAETIVSKPVDTPAEQQEVTLSQTSESPETTPYLVELEEHTTGSSVDTSTLSSEKEPSTTQPELQYTERGDQSFVSPTETTVVQTEEPQKEIEVSVDHEEKDDTTVPAEKEPEILEPTEKSTSAIPIQTLLDEQQTVVSIVDKEATTSMPVISSSPSETEKPVIQTEKPLISEGAPDTIPQEEELLPATSKTTTSKGVEETTTLSSLFDKFTKPEPSIPSSDLSKPGLSDTHPTDELPTPEFPPSGTSGYGQEPDYVEEDQAFGPGTCRYGGKVYVSAQQIPRDDPCDFCFCFRSDIICLQQSCPPPIHGCHEEPIQGFCCPRYECPVSMATTLNVTTTTTTTTTTLPPHFLPHAYKGAAQRRGCQIKGHTYKVGEVVRASSGPCLHCTCGGDGQMKCDPKACTPEPMLRQMIAAAVSAKRRR